MSVDLGLVGGMVATISGTLPHVGGTVALLSHRLTLVCYGLAGIGHMPAYLDTPVPAGRGGVPRVCRPVARIRSARLLFQLNLTLVSTGVASIGEGLTFGKETRTLFEQPLLLGLLPAAMTIGFHSTDDIGIPTPALTTTNHRPASGPSL